MKGPSTEDTDLAAGPYKIAEVVVTTTEERIEK
jgi:hypothetical protein